MSFFLPDKNGIVSGTKAKDDITWVNLGFWQTPLTVYAGDGDDNIDFRLSRYKNTINGEAGNDVIYGGTEADIINGGLGADKLYGYGANDKLFGNDGNDAIWGGSGNDSIEGGLGADKLYGESGNDTIRGGAGNDVITDNKGANKLYGDGGNDTVTGGSDNDYLSGGAGADKLYGMDGNDTIYGGTGADYAEGGAGVDKLYGEAGNDTLKGGAGNDAIEGGADADKLYGNAGNDTIKGGDGNDYLEGNSGTDKLYGNAGNDTIKGGDGNDYLEGNSGTNKLYGDAGLDTIKGGAGMDYIYGGADKDLIYGAGGNDILYGEDGSDMLYGEAGDDRIFASNGNDSIWGGDGDDSISAGNGNDKVYGGNGNDTIFTGSDSDYIDGGYGNDAIYVNSGKNTVFGGAGNDSVSITAGNNEVTGGLGNDTINIKTGNNIIHFKKGDGNDIIYNYIGHNTIVFDDKSLVSQEMQGNDLVITYGSSETVTIKDYTKHKSRYTIQNEPYIPPEEPEGIEISRGSAEKTLTLSASSSTVITLTNSLDGKKYTYELKANSTTQTATFEYLKNGRLLIKGSYITITARSGQEDNIIVQGNSNYINTGDKNDIVRVGAVTDGNGYYNKQSNYNKINTGAGNDYVIYYGAKNTIDTGAGIDDVYAASPSTDLAYENISNAESVRVSYTNSNTVNGKVDAYNQGYSGGDCRFLSIIQSLALTVNFNLKDYITITSYGSSYTVKYKNYTRGTNSVSISASELSNNSTVFGDLDVVLADMALNKLLSINQDEGHNSILNANYNTLSDYFFGTKDLTYLDSFNFNYDFEARFTELWNAYKSGSINNLTVGIFYPDDYSQGIISGHAYAVKDLTNSYIKLINVWDSQDYLTLDLDTFYNDLWAGAFGYGYDYYNEGAVVKQGSSPSPTYNCDLTEIAGEVASWQAGKEIADAVINNAANEKVDLTAYFVSDTSIIS